MSDPSLSQATSYASWYLSRQATPDEIDARLAASRDHQWMTPEERAACIAEAQRRVLMLHRIWAAYPHLRVELTPAARRRKSGKRSDGNRGPR